VRGRGIDFKQKFNTSRWAEDLLIRALGSKFGVTTVRYGLSTYVPEGQELVYGTSKYKDPDLLVFKSDALSPKEKDLLRDGSLDWKERAALGEAGLDALLKRASVALEVEFSPYQAKEMKGRHWKLRTPEKWDERPLKHATPPTAPNIWVKEEDIEKLSAWEKDFGIPIAVVHVFDQEAFAVALAKVAGFRRAYKAEGADANKLQVTSGIFAKIQDYDRVDMQGAGEQKPVFIVTPAAAEKVGDITGVKVSSQVDLSGSKKYVAHVIFTGGEINISDGFIAFLSGLSAERKKKDEAVGLHDALPSAGTPEFRF
jgi:hypothetical protein